MGTRGPPPTPTNILKMRDSWRSKRNPSEPKPERGRPRCPKWLSKEAKAVWKRLAPLLDRMGVLTRIDGNALARYCRLFARYQRNEDFLDQNGETHLVKDAEGRIKGVRAYPQVKIAAQLAAELLRLEREFGMTPSARSRIAAPQHDQHQADDKRRYLRLG